MNKTKIDWCDMTWNPVSGCLHGCKYCYAKKMARRFCHDPWNTVEDGINHFLGLPMQNEFYKDNRIDPYPYGFDPTFHRYKLNEPQKIKKSQRIFVVSMGDLFGEWVPDSWIQEVFKACEAAPQHKYLFLTKNPGRFQDVSLIQKLNISRNMWFGFSVAGQTALNKIAMGAKWLPVNSFISIEPLHEAINLTRIEPTGVNAFLNFLNGGQYWFMGGDDKGQRLKWVIVGAETGNRKGKVAPEKTWVESIIEQCRAANVPVFVKNPLYEKYPVQEWPEGLKNNFTGGSLL